MAARLYVNGRIFTGRGEDDFASAMRVEDGRFTWVGEAAAVDPDGAVDLRGRTVLPGFLDVHTHPGLIAKTVGAVACTPPRVNSIEDMVAALRASPAAGAGDDAWIEGWGYDESKLAEGRTPTARDLDRVSTTQPVYVLRSDCHSAICNSRALQIADITRDTPDPEGARFGRFDDGEPNGVLVEMAANDRVRRAMGVGDFDHEVERIARTGGHFSERGIVAVADMLSLAEPYPYLDLFRAAAARGLAQQVILYPSWAHLATRPAADLAPADREGDIRIGGLKLFMDGSVSGRTAWMTEPYRDSDEHGMAILGDDEIDAAHAYARRNGLQLAFHVMGDRAIGHVIDRFADEEPWLDGIPSVRLDHATMLGPAHLERIRRARMRFGVATQIIFFFAEHDSYVANLSDSQYRRAYPLRTLYHGLDRLALSSDCPATTWADPDDVFTSIKAAVTRRAYNGADIVADEAITVPQAILLYTGRARELADFPSLGRIQAGFDASFVELDRDIFAIPPEEIDQVRVERTHIRGELVYERGEAA
jgi:hypothetical protein